MIISVGPVYREAVCRGGQEIAREKKQSKAGQTGSSRTQLKEASSDSLRKDHQQNAAS